MLELKNGTDDSRSLLELGQHEPKALDAQNVWTRISCLKFDMPRNHLAEI